MKSRCVAGLRLALGATIATTLTAAAQPIFLPTANTNLFTRGGYEHYFVGTVGRPWKSGTYGCVRSEGWQLHEGLDIRPLHRDRQGEATDPILATADGTVMYRNDKAGLSNYGKYLILRHVIDGVEIYSNYAHLKEIRTDLRVGQEVKTGETLGIMGRTANTREGISKDRAHLHFELNLLLNDRFPAWFTKRNPGTRNDHGVWNGQNLAGFDPLMVLLEQRKLGGKFNLLGHLRSQTELCRVQVRVSDFPFVRRYRGLIRPNPVAQTEGIAGYEIAFNFAGVPFALTPRAASELQGKSRVHLVSVNAEEQRARPCRKLVRERGGRWELTATGENIVGLLIH